MNKSQESYLFELPRVGKKEALRRFWTRMVWQRGHMPTTLMRHKRQILRILDNAARAGEEEG
jgi:hypothetical protein